MEEESPDPESPFALMGGREVVLALAERFYDIMEETEPELTALHEMDEPGKVSRRSRDRFGLFLVGWLGGPQDYMERHGHPRLRMRHARVPVNIAMRDAWMRCMRHALEEVEMPVQLHAFLVGRLAHVANFLRNVEG